MKNSIPFVLLFCCVLLFNCKKTSSKFNEEASIVPISQKIKEIYVDKKELTLHQNEGVWYYKNEPFFGFSVECYENDQLKSKIGFHNGKRQGIVKKWFSNGILRYEYYYQQNRIEGVYKSWWNNGQQSEESFYNDGIKNGVEKKWYPTGQMAKLRTIKNSREDGMQKAWLKNGKLYVNYEAKNGRIFGLRRANNCYKLENEKIVRYDQ